MEEEDSYPIYDSSESTASSQTELDYLNNYYVPGATQRVVGGNVTHYGEFPHQVSLQDASGNHFCAASVIHPLLLLTAAHCFTMQKRVKPQAVTGAHNLTNYIGNEQFREVRRVILHEDYNNNTWDNDIALLVLNQSLALDTYTKLIDVEKTGTDGKVGAHVSGWGTTESGNMSDVLRSAWIRFSPNRAACLQQYVNASKPKNITGNMICAGGNSSDSCYGDSGGPLTCFKQKPSKGKANEFYLCGIVSFGTGCKQQVPGIYTDVSKYYEWIRGHMGTLLGQNSNETVDQSSAGGAIGESQETTTTAISTFADYYDYQDYSRTAGVTDDNDGVGWGEPGLRIAHGRIVNRQFPHQVALQDASGNHFCGASVIHALLLLTAAHCFTSYKPADVRAVTGAQDLTNFHGSEQLRSVSHVIKHEKWNDTTWDNDIALIVLNESLIFDNYTKPIDVWKTGIRNITGAYVTGWGKTEDETSFGVLRYGWIKFAQNRDDCILRNPSAHSQPINITENMICAEGNRFDSCYGDPGGPLTCFKPEQSKENPNKFYLCGIVSFGIGCSQGVPGIYTDVSKYYEWIKGHMDTWSEQRRITGKSLDGFNHCDAGMFRCENSGACIPDTFQCDGINDCDPLGKGDYDEKNCMTLACPASKFRCVGNSDCIHKNLVCDGVNQCEDGSDEIECEVSSGAVLTCRVQTAMANYILCGLGVLLLTPYLIKTYF